MQPLYPPVADLAVTPKPVPPDAIVTSERAAAEYSATLGGLGRAGLGAGRAAVPVGGGERDVRHLSGCARTGALN